MGAEKHPTVGSSGEYWSMKEILNQHFVENERFLVQNREDYESCKVRP